MSLGSALGPKHLIVLIHRQKRNFAYRTGKFDVSIMIGARTELRTPMITNLSADRRQSVGWTPFLPILYRNCRTTFRSVLGPPNS